MSTVESSPTVNDEKSFNEHLVFPGSLLASDSLTPSSLAPEWGLEGVCHIPDRHGCVFLQTPAFGPPWGFWGGVLSSLMA